MAEAAKKPIFLVVHIKDNQWGVKVDEGTDEDNSVPEYHRFSREDRAREHADRTQKFNEAASKAEALKKNGDSEPMEPWTDEEIVNSFRDCWDKLIEG